MFTKLLKIDSFQKHTKLKYLYDLAAKEVKNKTHCAT